MQVITLMGTATMRRRLNSSLRSSSFGVEPRIREPPEENGLMALDWAPRIVQANNTGALKPTEAARFGISGNNAGATTPVVELKKLMMAPTRQKAEALVHWNRSRWIVLQWFLLLLQQRSSYRRLRS